MIVLDARELDKRVGLYRPVASAGFRGAGGGTLELFDRAWAGIVDLRPARVDTSDGFPEAVRRSRIRMRYRADITPGMHVVYGARTLKIVTEPVELGRRAGIEMIGEEHRPAGNPA